MSDTFLGPLSHLRKIEVLRLADCREVSDTGLARFLGASAAATFGKVVEALGDGAAMLREAQADAAVTAREVAMGLAGDLARTIAGGGAPGKSPASAAAFDATLPKDVALRARTLRRLYKTTGAQYHRLAGLPFDPRHEPTDSEFESQPPEGPKDVPCLRSRLKWLDLTGCARLSDHSMVLIANYCPKLGAISCSGAPGITDAGLVALSRAPAASRAQVIRFEDCRSITGVGAARLLASTPLVTIVSFKGSSNVGNEVGASIQNLHRLRDLDLTGCLRVSDACIVGLPRGLRHIRLRGIPNITDDGVQRVLLSGRYLESIDLGHCGRVTDGAFLPLLERGGRSHKGQKLCPLLHTIDISGCRCLNPSVLRALAALRRKLGVFARHRSFGEFLPGSSGEPDAWATGSFDPDVVSLSADHPESMQPSQTLAPLQSESRLLDSAASQFVLSLDSTSQMAGGSGGYAADGVIIASSIPDKPESKGEGNG